LIFNGLFFAIKKVKIIDKIFGNVKYSSYVSFVIRDKQLKYKNMKIREFYLENYPSDELGVEINKEATFGGLWAAIRSGIVYDYIGVYDSIVRERCFEKLSELSGHDYEYIYNEWVVSEYIVS
jgi:hypothetical protein